uniref:Uncharacterized protein n=1 Tax=Anguilla anguilla TaxID=7936 RepID=A0A0E9WCN2_ANGAN
MKVFFLSSYSLNKNNLPPPLHARSSSLGPIPAGHTDLLLQHRAILCAGSFSPQICLVLSPRACVFIQWMLRKSNTL